MDLSATIGGKNAASLTISPYSGAVSDISAQLDFLDADQVIEAFGNFTSSKAVNMIISGTYGAASTLNANVVAKHIVGTTALDTGATVSETSFLRAKTVEVDRIRGTKELGVSGVGALDLSGVDLSISLPPLGVGLALCDRKQHSFAALGMDAISMPGTNVDFPFVVYLLPENATEMVGAFQRAVSGSDLKVCVVNHPEQQNLLSAVIARSDISLEFGLENSAGSGAPSPRENVLEINVTSTDYQACLAMRAEVALYDKDTVLGWGDITIATEATTGSAGEFFSLSVAKGSLSKAGGNNNAVGVTLCLVGNQALGLTGAATAVRNVLKNVIDGVALTVDISGSLTARLPPNSVHSISAPAVTFPANVRSAVVATESNVDSEFEVDIVELRSVSGDSIGMHVTFALGLGLGEIRLRLPPIQVAMSAMPGPVKMADLTISVPGATGLQVGYEGNIVLAVVGKVSTWRDALLHGNRILANTENWLIGPSAVPGANFLSRIIPETEITSGNDPEDQDPGFRIFVDLEVDSPAGQDRVDMTLVVEALQDLSPKLQWSGMNIDIYNGAGRTASDLVGSISSGLGGRMDVGRRNTFSITLEGSGASQVAKEFVSADNDVSLGVEGSFAEGTISSTIVIPAEVLAGSSSEGNELWEPLGLSEIKFLGGDDVGTNVLLGCYIPGWCDLLVVGDNDANAPVTGVTVGIKGFYDQQRALGGVGVRLHLTEQTDLFLNVSANGEVLGRGRVKGGALFDMVGGEIDAIVTGWVYKGAEEGVRQAAKQLMSGLDLVFTASGGAQAGDNMFSKILEGAVLDAEFVGGSGVDDAGQVVNDGMEMTLESTTRTKAAGRVEASIVYNGDRLPSISVGAIDVTLHYGHEWIEAQSRFQPFSGHEIVRAYTTGPLVVSPSADTQTVTAKGELFWRPEETGSEDAKDDFISKFIFRRDMAIELRGTITPVDSPAFEIWTYATIPAQESVDSMVDGVDIDIMGSVQSIVTNLFQNTVMIGEKKIINPLNFAMRVSYFEYKVYMDDFDGVAGRRCGPFAHGLLTPNTINPLASDAFDWPNACGVRYLLFLFVVVVDVLVVLVWACRCVVPARVYVSHASSRIIFRLCHRSKTRSATSRGLPSKSCTTPRSSSTGIPTTS